MNTLQICNENFYPLHSFFDLRINKYIFSGIDTDGVTANFSIGVYDPYAGGCYVTDLLPIGGQTGSTW